MSNEVIVARSIAFADSVVQLLQQKGTRFRKAVTERGYTGKDAKAVEQIGAVNAVKKVTRHSDTPLIETPHSARWVAPSHYEWADLIDDQDRLEMIVELTSPYAVNGADSMARAIDDEIVGAFYAIARTGENGTTNTAFDTANQQVLASVGATTGMNIAKLRAAKQILMANEVDVDNDMLFAGISAEQHDNLLAETETASLDFNTRPVLVDGRITAFMGFNFIDSERLPATGSDRRCPAWAKTGMHLGVWNDITGRIDERADKSYATQVYVAGSFGSTRTEEGKVVEILCTEV